MVAAKPLNVIALISGGKDSMYSILHCISQGHKIVAFANLSPEPVDPKHSLGQEKPSAEAESASESLNRDSFMFQTVGHTLIPLYAECLPNIPLYRSSISGKSSFKDREYRQEQGDEVEDMQVLLKNIMDRHLEADAVSSGAILSTYQRTRVEDVAARLGLVSLAYLWQCPNLTSPLVQISRHPSKADPASLLRDMASQGIDARIVKVASAGLDESFLWSNLCEEKTIRRLQNAMDRFGGSILGEGGEYETLVVSGPSNIWEKAIKVEKDQMTTVKGESGESWLAFSAGKTENAHDSCDDGEPSLQPRQPSLLDESFNQICRDILEHEENLQSTEHLQLEDFTPNPMKAVEKTTITSSENVLYISNVTESNGIPFALQVREVCKRVNVILSEHLDDPVPQNFIVHTIVILRRMSDFALFNHEYNSQLAGKGLPIPPSRVTIACGDCLPKQSDILLSAIVTRDTTQPKSGLHVQSRSFWAPANIGPYSQAKSLPLHDRGRSWRESDGTAIGATLVHVAGQIPLVPASMSLWSSFESGGFDVRMAAAESEFQQAFAVSAALALQHQWRIGVEQKIGFWTGAVAYIARSDGDDVFASRAALARRLWTLAHRRGLKDKDAGEEDEEDDDDDVDVWDRVHLGGPSWGLQAAAETETPSLPDWASVDAADPQLAGPDTLPPCFAVEVEELPRTAPIEWQSHGFTRPNAGCRLRYRMSMSMGMGMGMGGGGACRECSLCDGGRFPHWRLDAYTVLDAEEAGEDDGKGKDDSRPGGRSESVHASVHVVQVAEQSRSSTDDNSMAELADSLRRCQDRGARFTIYLASARGSYGGGWWPSLGTVVPCRRISGQGGAALAAVVVVNEGC